MTTAATSSQAVSPAISEVAVGEAASASVPTTTPIVYKWLYRPGVLERHAGQGTSADTLTKNTSCSKMMHDAGKRRRPQAEKWSVMRYGSGRARRLVCLTQAPGIGAQRRRCLANPLLYLLTLYISGAVALHLLPGSPIVLEQNVLAVKHLARPAGAKDSSNKDLRLWSGNFHTTSR